MKRKQYKTIAIAIMACWLFLAIVFLAGKIAPTGARSLTTEFDTEAHNEEVPTPFTLKAVSRFLLQ